MRHKYEKETGGGGRWTSKRENPLFNVLAGDMISIVKKILQV